MIADALQHWKRYALGKAWAEVMTWVEANGQTADLGVYPVGDCLIKVEEGQTQPEADRRYESHRAMVDMQMVVDGVEWVLCTDSTVQPLLAPFDEGRDVGFHQRPAVPMSRVHLVPGVFTVLFPWDAHAPLVMDDAPRVNRKIVAKIPLDSLATDVYKA